MWSEGITTTSLFSVALARSPIFCVHNNVVSADKQNTGNNSELMSEHACISAGSLELLLGYCSKFICSMLESETDLIELSRTDKWGNEEIIDELWWVD